MLFLFFENNGGYKMIGDLNQAMQRVEKRDSRLYETAILPVYQRVEGIIRERLGLAPEVEVRPGSEIGEDLGGDSLDTTEVVMDCEEDKMFGIPDENIPDEDSERFVTPYDIVLYLIGREGSRVYHAKAKKRLEQARR